MKINLDFKSIIILILLSVSVIFFTLWFLSGTGYKKDFKNLQNKIDIIQKSRDSLKLVNKKLKIDFDKIQNEIDLKNIKLKNIETELQRSKRDLNSARSEVIEIKKDLAETKKKIETLKKDPIKREDDQLLNSLRKKLNP